MLRDRASFGDTGRSLERDRGRERLILGRTAQVSQTFSCAPSRLRERWTNTSKIAASLKQHSNSWLPDLIDRTLEDVDDLSQVRGRYELTCFVKFA